MTGSKAGRPDRGVLGATGVLLVVGLNMVYSASYVVAHNSPGLASDTYFLVRQAVFAVVGLTGLGLAQAVDYHLWRRASVPFIVVSVALLVTVLVSRLGHAAYGAQRWLQVGPLVLQPGEFAKLALILYLADWLSRRQDRLDDVRQVALPFAIAVGTIFGLVVLQPDLGSAFVIGATAVGMYFVAGAPLRHLVLGLAGGTIGIVGLIFGAAYRLDRVRSYLHATPDPLGIDWNITQAKIALGSGGILGRGLGASRQKFYYLPNAHTDAIFAVVGEELGLVGGLLVLVLFATIAYRGLRIARDAPDAYGALIATGITWSLVLQAFVNVGVVTAVLPFTGIPLPFISYGGSSLVESLVGVGILLNVSRHVVFQRFGARPGGGFSLHPRLRQKLPFVAVGRSG